MGEHHRQLYAAMSMERNDRFSEFEIENGVLKAYHGPGGQVFVPKGTMAIGPKAFYDQREITAIAIPDGVREIGDRAFSCCTNIRSMAVSGSVKRIGAMAFYFCENLIDVTIGQGVRELGDEAFMDCRRLTRASLPDSLTDLGAKAFFDCDRLLRIEIPKGITHIGERTFANCRALGSVSLPKTVTHIGDKAFYGCFSLKRMELPLWLTHIHPQTFGHCMALENVSLPAGLQCIEEDAFIGCKRLRELSLPDGLTSIGKKAFHGCEGLTDVEIPDSVTKVGDFAFSDCTGLVLATFADSIESVNVFSGCASLKEYAVSTRSRRYRAVDGVVFSRDGRKLIAYPPGRRCDRYDIPETVTEVSDWAFFKAQAKVVYVPDGVKTFSKVAAVGVEENDPFVASARADLMTDLGKPIYLGPVDALPPRHQRRVVEGFLAALEIGMPEMEPWKESYINYIRQEYAVYEKKAWKNEPLLRLLMAHRMLRPETAELMRRKYSGTGRMEMAEQLTAYLKGRPV